MTIASARHMQAIADCGTIDEVSDYASRCPIAIRQDERFARAVQRRLGEIAAKRRKHG